MHRLIAGFSRYTLQFIRKIELTSSGIASVCDTNMLRHMTAIIAMRHNLINLDIFQTILDWLQNFFVNPWSINITRRLFWKHWLYWESFHWLYTWLSKKRENLFEHQNRDSDNFLKKIVRCFMNEQKKYYAVSMRLRCVL